MADDTARSTKAGLATNDLPSFYGPTRTCAAGDPYGTPATRPSPPAPPPDPPPGYDLIEEVGRGGMGVVYRARDLELNRTVAVKFLKHGPCGDAERFIHEARITSQLQHPNIPPVHKVGALPDGRRFLVMKLVRGENLHTRLKRCETAADRARFLAAFEQVCQAVGYAHANGVIHRDLKPANVMVGAFGEVQVMDWGLAKVLGDEPRPAAAAPAGPAGGAPATADPACTEIRSDRGAGSVTEAGSVLGTPAFMPPEQAAGAVHLIDERSDVFGLGAILCVILTAEPPYVDPDPHVVRLLAANGQLVGAHARLDACGSNPELVALCKRCLCPGREGRPRNANELAAAVADIRAAAEERARDAELNRVRAEAEARELRARRKVCVVVAVSAACLLAAGGALAWWQDRLESRQREAELHAQLDDQREEAERQERLRRNGDAVAALLGTAEEAVRADDARAAKLAFAQAEARAAEGGAEHLAARLARCRAELDLLLDLDRIEERRWTVVGGKNSGGRPAAAELPAAFARYGIVPGSEPDAEALDRIRNSLLRDRILTALDWWLDWSRSPAVLALLRAADPDEFRGAVRAAVAADVATEVDRLAAQPEALAQPTRFAIVLGDAIAVPPHRRRELVLAALKKRPGDHQLLVTVGYLAMIHDPGNTAEYEKWFRAAVAVRPGSPIAHNYVGLALRNKNLPEEAAAEFRESIALDPGYAGANNNLAWVLATARDHRLRDGRRAVELATRACEVTEWTVGSYIDTLAAALAEVGEFDKAVECAERAIASPDLDPAVRAAAAERLELYQQRKPYRIPGHFAGPAPPQKALPR